MPNISWNEIKHNALLFSRSWEHVTSEQAEKQTFWNDFFHIFGISRRLVATFESPVRRRTGSTGFIDLLWRGKLLVEHKSAGESLEAAESQAFAYVRDLHDTGRDEDIPRFVLLSDFRRFALYDLEPEDQLALPLFAGLRYHREEFPLGDLRHNVGLFAFIPNYTTHKLAPQDPANIRAVELMANLHDTLKRGGYGGHDLERFLVRVLFCLFAEDTGIFEPDEFQLFLENRTQRDGSDLGARLAQLFQTLNQSKEARQRNLDETLASFPWVNGQLFSEHIGFADFNRPMREALLRCCRFDWARISPAIFGALFQNVIDQDDNPNRRRNLGAHYTSERDILKLIKPLFLDGLRAEFNAARSDRSGRGPARLDNLRRKLTQLNFLDPACGCGNFLVIAYRELRLLELDILKQQHGTQQALTLDEVSNLSQLDVDQFYGIEIEEWPARIAEVALWLMDHQSNMLIHEAFSQPCLRLPLRNSPHIHICNALRTEWSEILSPAQCSYILGNPPFIGHQWRHAYQVADMDRTWGTSGRFGRLDYVTCWYRKATEYMQQNSAVTSAFVSTNSISQGEQVGILWSDLLDRGVKINFAHRTFKWMSEARGKAAVHCVIIGFALEAAATRWIFDYDMLGSEPKSRKAQNINPYLVDAPNVILPSRTAPVSTIPQMKKGSQPTDGGYLIFTEQEKNQFLKAEPNARIYLRPYWGGEEFLTGSGRWCLWLKDAQPSDLRKLPLVAERIKGVRAARLQSPTKSVRDYAGFPTLFTQDRQPRKTYLALPEVSSENRRYIPVGFLKPTVIASNKLQLVVGATKYHLGIISSTMHMAWVRTVSGRLESRYSYAPAVYNNFPWPLDSADTHRPLIETLAQAVLDARAAHPTSTLADLYDPLYMPANLLRAHQALDRAVDRLYRPEPFPDDQARVEHLFQLYERLTAPLLPVQPKQRRRAQSI